MRFSAVQDDAFGVELAHEHLVSDVDEAMMAATGENSPDGRTMVDESSMTYNLPLLFANGYPTSLEKISETELEHFITFMMQCCSDPLSAGPIVPPQWWPKEVKFSNPFLRPERINENWMGNLKKLVYSCYTYHRSEYLIRFCSYLAQYPREKLYYVNNWDSTTSLYHRSTGKLLATFRNENMEYDKVVDNSRRSLLSCNKATSQPFAKTKKTKHKKRRVEEDSSLVVIQPELEEIYLCDNCDAEFGNFEKMKDHEKICGEPAQNNVTSRPITPDEPIIEPELNQNQFLDYFNLSNGNEPRGSNRIPLCNPPSPTVYIEPTRNSRRLRTAVNLTRCPTIPFSSPAGLIMIKKSKTMNENTQQERLDRIERHLTAPPLNKFNRPKWLDRVVQYNRWSVTYKPNRTVTEKPVQDNYVHKYTFGAYKQKSALSIKSQLLYVACGTCYVKLERLTEEKLEDLKNHPWKYHPPRPRTVIPRPRSKPVSKMIQAVANEKPCHDNMSNGQSFIKQKVSMDLVPVNAKRKLSGPLQNVERRVSTRNQSDQWRSEPAKTIVFVDLCSSDEEENISSPVLCDENRDPMSTTENTLKTNILKTVLVNPTVHRPKSCGYKGATVSDWLRQGSFSQDNENRTNNVKCIGNVLDGTKFTTVLKTSP